MKSFEQIAKEMFEAYQQAAHPTIPSLRFFWNGLSEHGQNMWIAAAKAAHKAITEDNVV